MRDPNADAPEGRPGFPPDASTPTDPSTAGVYPDPRDPAPGPVSHAPQPTRRTGGRAAAEGEPPEPRGNTSVTDEPIGPAKRWGVVIALFVLVLVLIYTFAGP